MSSRERFLREKAKKAGYKIIKGFVHYLYNNSVYRNPDGKRVVGYSICDMSTGFYVWGCYDNNFDNLWNLCDVENFLRDQYSSAGLDW